MKTICEMVENEIIIKNSRFITILYPINKKEDVEKYLESIRKEYPKATHYCYAYKLFDYKKCDDDGEPSNTAGLPILNVLEKEDVENVLCVVIRYFGGIKLGAGGLVRAYSKSVSYCIHKASFQELVRGYKVNIFFHYENIKQMDYLLKDAFILEKKYGHGVCYQVLSNQDMLVLFDKNQVNYEILEETYIPKK